ncbi:hypothetical protein CFIMG_000546RAa [Ceratocystis fimbriata CBS 114723]|uniref:Uncharacterized protein n=1 Tax=Ceratocystis fimbriata CBS 114723 TaxID=1035309 RepID=A0A2C5XGF6_9PEZI|nr:hypothetical protein CFIMG_000546RAa [Ceratocystis fimbriata CBS 114723]
MNTLEVSVKRPSPRYVVLTSLIPASLSCSITPLTPSACLFCFFPYSFSPLSTYRWVSTTGTKMAFHPYRPFPMPSIPIVYNPQFNGAYIVVGTQRPGMIHHCNFGRVT